MNSLRQMANKLNEGGEKKFGLLQRIEPATTSLQTQCSPYLKLSEGTPNLMFKGPLCFRNAFIFISQ
jgi:hypothetical protein